MTNNFQYDLIILGATGFVGSIVCKYLLSHIASEENVKWAIAGRSQTKLDNLINTLGMSTTHLTTLIADVTDEAALTVLCAQTRVIVSTVGPYALYGETLVKVCAITGTDYCDLTGEVQWIQQMIQKYAATAQRSGSRIIHCCGFDSIPSDLGVYYLQQQAQQRWGEPCVQVKMRVKAAKGGISGGTAASGVNLVKEAIANPTTRQALANPYSLCPAKDKYPEHPPTLVAVKTDNIFQEWIAPFIMAGVNTPIVLRSNALQDWAYGDNFQYDEAILTGQGILGWIIAQGLKVGLDGLTLAAMIPPTRWILEQIIPKSGEGPSAEEQVQGFYDLRFWGQTASGQTLMLKVTGDRDPGYGSTAKILAQAGICLAKDIPKSAMKGGFWTPATIFGEILVERLIEYAGLTFEII